MARTAEHYQHEAERCRAQALDTSDEDLRANLLDVARQYDVLSTHSLNQSDSRHQVPLA